jgi:5-methylcytosine-specific restriction endonuclease McrA
MDHVIPRSRGGEHRWENVVCSCRKCNGRKADKLLSEIGWTLNRTPYAPTGTVWLLIGRVRVVDPAWEPYLQVA